MDLKITINIGLTDQLAGFLTKLVGGVGDQHVSETTTRPAPRVVAAEAPKSEDPFAAPAQTAEQDSTTSASATGTSTDSAAEKPSRRKSSKGADAGSPVGTPAVDPFASTAAAQPGSLSGGDAFSQQIRQANAETAAEALANDQPAYTVKDLNDAAAAYMAKHKAAGVKALLESNFKAADGSPVDRLSVIQQSDYPEAVRLLREGA